MGCVVIVKEKPHMEIEIVHFVEHDDILVVFMTLISLICMYKQLRINLQLEKFRRQDDRQKEKP